MLNKMRKITEEVKKFFSNDQKSISEYIDLEMNRIGHKTALQCSSGALVTLVKVNGIGVVGAKEEQDKLYKALLQMLNKFFSNKDGPIISWMYSQSSETVKSDLDDGLKASRQAAQRLGMDASSLITDIVEANAPLCHTEEIYIALWTLPKFNVVMKKGKEVREKTNEDKLSRFFTDKMYQSANPLATNGLTQDQHDSDIGSLTLALSEGGLLHETVPALDALQWMKFKFNDGKVSRFSPFELYEFNENEPRFRGGKVNFNLTDGTVANSSVFMPRLSEQIPESVIIPSASDADGILYSNGRFHGTFTLDVNPKSIVNFNSFLKNVTGIDFRMTFIMSQVDTSGYEAMNIFLNNFFRANDNCKKVYDQLQFQKFMKTDYDCSDLNLQVLIVISASDRRTLLVNRKKFNDGLVDWGRAEMKLDNNDPVQTLVSSIPGLNYRSFARGCWITTDRLVRIMPNERPGTFWDYGLICFRTKDGKPFFFQPQSLLQDYDLSLFIAPPRQGKSLLMNAKGVATVLGDGVSKLGLMVILDIGPTSRGALQLLRYMLVKSFAHKGDPKTIEEIKNYKNHTEQLIIEHEWSPEKDDWNVNPLETRIGFNRPTKDEQEFMLNFYVTICSESESGEPLNGTSKLLEELLDEVFNNANSNDTCKMFNTSIDKELTSIARNKLNLDLSKTSISMYKLRDMLFQRNMHEAALKAHRLSMPTVNQMVQILSNSVQIKEGHSEKLINAIKGMLNTHIKKMPYLTKPSTIDFQTANIISFDMKPVAKAKSNQGKLDTFAQYLLAMHLGMRRFFLGPALASAAPPLYQKYWAEQVVANQGLKKCLSLDEWHALSVKAEDSNGKEYAKSQAGAEYIDFLIREAPKWGLSINLASHRAADFTETMKALSTNRFIFSGLEREEILSLQNQMGLSDSEVKLLLDGIHGPRGGVGNEIFYQFKSSKIKGSGGSNVFSARIKYLCSGLLMWALSTDQNDMPHKFRLEMNHPEKDWLEALYKAFPKGNMSDLRESIRKEMREQLNSDQDVEGRTNDIEEFLHGEVLKHLGANPNIKKIASSIIEKSGISD